jgi:putative addiction module killer protein
MLTDAAIRAAKPREKTYKLFDGLGLYLEVAPTESKLWRIKYRRDGRENRLALGARPDTSLKLARERRDAARRQLAAGIDPSSQRQAEKLANANTFEAVAREWLALQEKKLAPATFAKAGWTFETLVFPYIGSRPIAKLSAMDVLKVLKRIDRLKAGLFGDWKSVGSGECELQIDHGPGYRVYYGQEGKTLILLLCGGDKSTQVKDIETAHAY